MALSQATESTGSHGAMSFRVVVVPSTVYSTPSSEASRPRR